MCMYNTNIRADQTQPENQLPLQQIIAATPAVTMTETVDWRTKLPPHSRQKIVNKMMETVQRHLPFREQKGLSELKKIVERVEDKFYTGATSQLDYLRKISMKMLTIKNKSQPILGNALQSNAGTVNQDPADSGQPSAPPSAVGMSSTSTPNVSGQNSTSLTTAPPSVVGMSPASIPNVSGQNSNLQSMQNIPIVAQQLPMPITGNQFQLHQQVFPQSIQNNMESPVMQNSATAPSSAVGMSPASIPYVSGQNSNLQSMQNISNVAQNSMANFMVQGMQSNMLANTQPHMLGRQQMVSQQLLQQQHLLNLLRIPQQQISKQKQDHLIGLQSNNSGMPGNQENLHTFQQSRVSAQQPLQQSASFIPTQGQQSQQMQLLQQQLMSQMQSQIAQLQQQIVSMQQRENTLQRDTHLRVQTSTPLPHQNVVDLSKQMSQLQMQIPDGPSSSLDSTAQIGSVDGGDWQEDVYQKIRSMKEMYFAELNELYQRIETKIQLLGIPQQPKKEHLEKLKFFKAMLEKLLQFLSLNKIDIQIAHREKIGLWEKQIANIVKSNKPQNPVSLPQGQVPQSRMHVFQQNPQSQPQISQIQPHESQMSSQMKLSMDVHSVVPAQQNNISNLQQNMVNILQSNSSLALDSKQGNAQNSLQQVALGSIQQNPVAGTQQVVSNLNSLQQNSNTIQQLMQHQQRQTMLQLQQQQLLSQQQQLFHRQLHEHQQRQHQTKQQQQSAQLPSNNMFVDQMLQELATKAGTIQQHQPAGQFSCHQPQLKSGTLPISSPSHHVTQHLSRQIDQQNMPTSEQKARTPLQYLSSPFIVPSPSTPLAPSSMPAETEKVNTDVLSLADAGAKTEKVNTDVLPLADAGAIGIYLFMYLLGLLGFINLLESLGSVDQLDL